MSKVSIITPAFNAELYIKEAIESAIAQTYSNFEMIVVDDGSTDSTAKIVASFQDPRIKLFSQKNRGVEAARNVAISKADGEVISFLDADDVWAPGKLESELAILKSKPDIHAVYSWVGELNTNGQKIESLYRTNLSGKIFPQILELNALICGSNLTVRKEVIDAVGQMDEALHWLGDWDQIIRIAKNYKFYCTQELNVWYRKSRNSMSSKTDLAIKDFRSIYKKHFFEKEVTKKIRKKGKMNFFAYLFGQITKNDHLNRFGYLHNSLYCICVGKLYTEVSLWGSLFARLVMAVSIFVFGRNVGKKVFYKAAALVRLITGQKSK